MSVKHYVGRPDYRNNGKYQFIHGYTGGGAEMCLHIDPEELSDRCRQAFGNGTLVDDGTELWWKQACQSPSLLIDKDELAADVL